MDEFGVGTVEYDEAHGLYRRGRRLVVVSPGDRIPKRAERLHSLSHPGVVREYLASIGPHPASLERVLRADTIAGEQRFGVSGQGVDISEFQGSTPGGFSFYLIRGLNENGRQDSRIWQHKGDVERMGAPAGIYGIIRPWNIDAGEWGRRLVGLIRASGWQLVPTIDCELGDAYQNRLYCQTVLGVLAANGIPAANMMGYYSLGSAYRQQCQSLFGKQWWAAWGARFPTGANVHQWQGSPLDLDWSPDLGAIAFGGSVVPPTPPPPPSYPIAMVNEEEFH